MFLFHKYYLYIYIFRKNIPFSFNSNSIQLYSFNFFLLLILLLFICILINFCSRYAVVISLFLYFFFLFKFFVSQECIIVHADIDSPVHWITHSFYFVSFSSEDYFSYDESFILVRYFEIFAKNKFKARKF